MQLKHTVIAAVLATTSFSSLAEGSDTATIGVNGGFATACEIVDAPATLSFSNMVLGDITTQQFDVTIECAIADVNTYPTITMANVSVSEIGGYIRFTAENGLPTSDADTLEWDHPFKMPSSTGTHTYTFTVYGHVMGVDYSSAPTTPSAFTTSVDVELYINS